ncbi:MAG TPA: hypothetical protein VHC47_05240, partial [Mucilaginibacter sp.]|nr:hypothetical protein [Mucilaginibacter sp.]
MTDKDTLAFIALFKDAYQKCFGHALEDPMSETESKLLCNQVLELTGLSIGWKSVKNYSFFVTGRSSAKEENPSAATLDTLARYVLGAPHTTELKRKAEESHYPWWFMYRDKFMRSTPARDRSWQRTTIVSSIILIAIAVAGTYLYRITAKPPAEFSDDFNQVSDKALHAHGWLVNDKDENWWNKKGEVPGELTLYTLKGDNWPDTANKQGIKNLLTRKIPYDCFTAELHLRNFIPRQEWQQAGLILLEDTSLTGKSVRLSIAFNDYFAGAHLPREIYIQAITSQGNGFSKPEEIAHKPILYPDSVHSNSIQLKMLQNSALRIEKHGDRFRFLYSDGLTGNTAFREVVSQDIDIRPKYIGIFAIRGFKDSTAAIPVHFTA